MTALMPGATQHAIPGHVGGSFLVAARRRIVLHSTEGGSVAGAIAAYKAKGVPPHLTVDPKTGEIVQHVSLERSAYALKNLSGGVETNRQGAIQVEIVGFAAKMQDMDDLSVVWLGTNVLRPLQAAVGCSLDHPAFVGTEAGTIATTGAKQRFSAAEWIDFGGVCGHQHVPENDHWDPGHLRIDAIVAFARAGQTPPPPVPVPPPADPTQAQLRRLAAGTYLPSVGDFPVPMGGNTGAPALQIIRLQQILNLIFPTAHISENGSYDGPTAYCVAVFQTLINQLSPGAIDDAFPGAISVKTKFFLGVALANIRDGK